MRRTRTLTLLAAVATAALLPLYGDTRPAEVVSHPEWARLLLRGLELLTDAPGVNDTAVQAFATLSGRDSRVFPARDYVRASRMEPAADGLRAAGGIGEAVYAVGVARSGDYRLRLRLAADAAAEAEISRAGNQAVLRRLTVEAMPAAGWSDASSVHLEEGAYDATVLLPEGGRLEYLELAPPCVSPIEPPGGWQPLAVTTIEDVAVTVLQALDLESELPPRAAPLEFRGSDLRLEEGELGVASTSGAFRGGPRGARVVLEVEIPEDGLYSMSFFGVRAGGQRWVTDGCRSRVICPSPDPTPGWHVILSAVLQKGRHHFEATLGADTVVERLRLEAKKNTSADYVATVEHLGLALGPAGPVTREKAEEARRFLSRQRGLLSIELCGDILRAGTLVAELAASGPSSSGGGGGGSGDGGGGGGDGGGGGGGGGDGGGGGGPIPPAPPPVSPTLPVRFAGD